MESSGGRGTNPVGLDGNGGSGNPLAQLSDDPDSVWLDLEDGSIPFAMEKRYLTKENMAGFGGFEPTGVTLMDKTNRKIYGAGFDGLFHVPADCKVVVVRGTRIGFSANSGLAGFGLPGLTLAQNVPPACKARKQRPVKHKAQKEPENKTLPLLIYPSWLDHKTMGIVRSMFGAELVEIPVKDICLANVVEALSEKKGYPVVICSWDGRRLKDDDATRDADWWKKSQGNARRKLTFLKKDDADLQADYIGVMGKNGPPIAKRIRLSSGQQFADKRRELNRETAWKSVKRAFSCPVCHMIATREVAICPIRACRRLMGCRDCVARYREDDAFTTKCPKCQHPISDSRIDYVKLPDAFEQLRKALCPMPSSFPMASSSTSAAGANVSENAEYGQQLNDRDHSQITPDRSSNGNGYDGEGSTGEDSAGGGDGQANGGGGDSEAGGQANGGAVEGEGGGQANGEGGAQPNGEEQATGRSQEY